MTDLLHSELVFIATAKHQPPLVCYQK